MTTKHSVCRPELLGPTLRDASPKECPNQPSRQTSSVLTSERAAGGARSTRQSWSWSGSAVSARPPSRTAWSATVSTRAKRRPTASTSPTGRCAARRGNGPASRLGLRRPGDHACHAPVLPDPAQPLPARPRGPPGPGGRRRRILAQHDRQLRRATRPSSSSSTRSGSTPSTSTAAPCAGGTRTSATSSRPTAPTAPASTTCADLVRRETDPLPHLRDQFPAAWFAIKDRLAAMQRELPHLRPLPRALRGTRREGRRGAGDAGGPPAQPGHRPQLQGRPAPPRHARAQPALGHRRHLRAPQLAEAGGATGRAGLRRPGGDPRPGASTLRASTASCST